MNKKPVLEAKDLKKSFAKPSPLELLTGIDLTLYEGEKVAIVGKSGEGKTTLLHILATLDRPTSGNILIDNKPIRDTCHIRNALIGFVFQSFCLLQDSSCLENLLMPARIAREKTDPKSRAYLQALALLEKVDLSSKKDLISSKCSGGEMQRVAIARAFMQNPKIIFADEPTGNLDHNTALDVQKLLFSWVEEENKTLLLVTHDLDLAKQCDRIFLLESGKLKSFQK